MPKTDADFIEYWRRQGYLVLFSGVQTDRAFAVKPCWKHARSVRGKKYIEEVQDWSEIQNWCYDCEVKILLLRGDGSVHA